MSQTFQQWRAEIKGAVTADDLEAAWKAGIASVSTQKVVENLRCEQHADLKKFPVRVDCQWCIRDYWVFFGQRGEAMTTDFTKPLVIVSGLGRCGSSLTMQMLQACGLNCAGDFPAFEPEQTNLLSGPLNAAWAHQFEAVKILDPHRGEIPKLDAVVIWLERNVAQQAISQIKFVRMVGGLEVNEGAAAKICKSLQRERPRALRKYFGYRQIHVAFEDAILHTELFCKQIANFLSPWYALDQLQMAACVAPRTNGPRCQADMKIEMELYCD